MREVFITLLWIVFIIDAIFLVLIILLQSGRGGGLSGMLGGGGGGESALGPKTGLNKVTGWMAAVFFASAILIGIMTRPRGTTKVEEAPEGEPQGVEAPAEPGDQPEATETDSTQDASAAEETP